MLAEDGLARVAAERGVQAWSKAGGAGRKLQVLATDSVVHLMRRARAEDGTTWWSTPAIGDPYIGPQLGWVGAAALTPINPDCPAGGSPRSASELSSEPWFNLACFGDRELELEGSVRCLRESGDSGIQGAPWMEPYRWCWLDDVLGLNGAAATSLLPDDDQGPVTERHVVRGHFDDPGARHCVAVGLGGTIGPNAGAGDPAAIELCRTEFVVDEMLPPTGG